MYGRTYLCTTNSYYSRTADFPDSKLEPIDVELKYYGFARKGMFILCRRTLIRHHVRVMDLLLSLDAPL